jgi:hypothetical protein
MALETAGYISALVPSNPPSGDPVSQADDHIRLIKGVLQATFPNASGAITSTVKQFNSDFVPVGGIIIWSGSASAIPAGWGLCNGSTYTKLDGTGSITSPNLTDNFVVGAGATYAVAATGGQTSVTPTITVGSYALTQADLPNYSLTVTDPGHKHTLTDPGHTHSYTAGGTVGGAYGGGPYNFSAPYSATTGTSVTGITMANGSTGITVSSAGGGGSHTHTGSTSTAVSTMPPYYALCFIMKL